MASSAALTQYGVVTAEVAGRYARLQQRQYNRSGSDSHYRRCAKRGYGAASRASLFQYHFGDDDKQHRQHE